ncbi:Na/Pi cotransporter family protein [Alicyclobacillus contaminans]|uniref:Na/Pi cotransporter family protein n=1 Tax=Alicyclobacillus contaminans TaxID=392016 RepID=UPI0024816DA2|nr:Na/Pi symporter [Alicyclobacillus contaminans]
MAGLSLFTFLGGLRVMRQGLEGLGEGRLPLLLQRFARTPTRGILTGTIVTALMQSSAAVTAISVGLVASGSLLFRDALGIVLGANVGSTVTPQMLTFDLWLAVIPCLGLGFIGIASRRPRLYFPSVALLGFSALVIGLEMLTTALQPLAASAWFHHLLQTAGMNPLLAAGAGCLLSAAIQSSTATTVITMALATQALIPMSGAISIVLGANVGTCLTSVLAAVGQTRPAQQVALAHVLLNIGGVALFLPCIAPFTEWMTHLATSPAQQIANAHTLFNIVCTLLVWPVTGWFARLVERLLPDQARA